jgi:hypothetical protein
MDVLYPIILGNRVTVELNFRAGPDDGISPVTGLTGIGRFSSRAEERRKVRIARYSRLIRRS